MELVGGLQSVLCDLSFESILPKIFDCKTIFTHSLLNNHENFVFNFHTNDLITALNLNFNKNFPLFTTFRHTKRKQSVKMNCNWFNALKIVFFIFLLNTNYLVMTEEIPNDSVDDDSDSLQIPEPDEARMAKRAWKQLQGSWGKRSFDGMSQEQLRKLNSNFQNDDYLESLRSLDYEPTRFHDFNMISDSDEFEDPSPTLEKRAWKSMNGAWGKRNWNQMRGNGWGKKREPGNWNNLRGLWGKRSSPQNWNKLSSAWGK